MTLAARFPFVLAAALALAATASAGTRIKNGGSGVLCPGLPPMVTEYALSQLQTPLSQLPVIEDREQFISFIIGGIDDPVFAKLLREQWELYGDSKNWPEGSMSGIEVYFQVGPDLIYRYGERGTIPAGNPADPLCAFPIYDLDRCCTRVLLSYFDQYSPTPSRLAANYGLIDRYQQNVLELHEALYRVARKLAFLPAPPLSLDIAPEVAAYRKTDVTGEIPADVVLPMTIRLMDGKRPDDRAFHIAMYWHWARAIYGAPASSALR